MDKRSNRGDEINMEINDNEWKKRFDSKDRLCCAECGGNNFMPHTTKMPNTNISEAVMLECVDCGHSRLELM